MAYASSDAVGTTRTSNPTRRLTTETKSAFKTTEMLAYLGAVIAVIITAFAVGQGDNGGADPFSALDAIRYISYLTIGYMIARGLAKSGSRDRYDEQDGARR
jgi:hypothetical protein